MQQSGCFRRCGFVSGNAVATNPRWSCRSTAVSRHGEAEQKARAYRALVAQAEIELAFHSPETVGSWHARWSDRVAEHDLKPCSGSGASVFRHWPEWNAGSGRICHSGRLSQRLVWRQGWPVMLSVRWSGGWCRTNSGRRRDAQQSHGFPVNGLNERIIFRKSECGQRAGYEL